MLGQNSVVRGYKFDSHLGSGGFGEVWQVSKNQQKYAVKVISGRNAIEAEQHVANNIHFSNPFLVKYLDHFLEDGRLFIVMEFCENGDLSQLLEYYRGKKIKMESDLLMRIFIQLLLGLHALHKERMIHRDIKPQNMFVNRNYDIKIGDFGWMKILDTTKAKADTVVGTCYYMAPEMISGKSYDVSVDSWSLGVLLYEMCTLELPFNHENPFAVPPMIMNGEFKHISKDSMANDITDIVDIVDFLLILDPELRPSTVELLKFPLVQTFASKLGLLVYFPPETLKSEGSLLSLSSSASSSAPSSSSVPFSSSSSPSPHSSRCSCSPASFELASPASFELASPYRSGSLPASPTIAGVVVSTPSSPHPAHVQAQAQENSPPTPSGCLSTGPVVRFSQTLKSAAITVSPDGRKAQVMGKGGEHTVFLCDERISSGIVTVLIQIQRLPGRGYCMLGLHQTVPSDFSKGRKLAYGLCSDFGGMSLEMGLGKGKRKVVTLRPLTQGDSVVMVVDVAKGDLEFRVNCVKCAELRDVSDICGGIYLAALMESFGTEWTVVSSCVQ